ncbi:MAG: hypothetical protein HY512_02860 [Candidatus Aenigmarchaeota archaeon]|nr:hypothetical protein [Candidatus Aenigmarchaeota archaeon]
MANYVVVEFEIYPALDKGMESVRLSPLLSAKDRLAADYLFITESKVMDVRNSVPGMMGSSDVRWYSVIFAKRGDVVFVDVVREEVARAFPEPIGAIPTSSWSKYGGFRELTEFELREEFETHLRVQGEWDDGGGEEG